MGVEARQGKQGRGRGRGTEWVNVPGELWPDPKGLIEKPVSFCKESVTLLVTRGRLTAHQAGWGTSRQARQVPQR